ncbi:MAG: small multi-drug export protein [Methanoregula sp.]|nr:MAG: small multi-drug export protein [Methanoregula sp.]
MPDILPHSRPGFVFSAAFAIFGVVVAPLTLAGFAGVPLLHMISLIGSILVFQPFAASVGVVLGIPPLIILGTMASVGIGAIIGILALCDLFTNRWQKFDKAVHNVNEQAHRSAGFQKYGMLMFIPFIWVPGLGLYGCTLIAWLLGWRQIRHIMMLFLSWMIAAALILGASLGILIALS